MREYIKNQLKNCIYADLSNCDEKQHIFFIPKYNKPTFNIGKCYLIKIDGDIINNTTSIVAINWNYSTAPRYPYYKIYVTATAGKMIQVEAVAYDFDNKQDLNDIWSGWLELNKITQIAIL